jgi:hypothetical protein
MTELTASWQILKRRAGGALGSLPRVVASSCCLMAILSFVRMIRVLVLVFLILVGSAAEARAQLIAVFIDGRVLPVAGATLISDNRIRLELPGGGSMEVPSTRVDHVIADDVVAAPEPLPPPPVGCALRFGDGVLPEGTAFAAEITAAARAANLSPALVAAVIHVESRFKPMAVSRVGAAGLMQLMPAVWIGAGLASPFVPADNLRVGCRHLAALLGRYGDLERALAAYNAGAAVVDRYHGVPPYSETRAYVRDVLTRFCPDPAGEGGHGNVGAGEG